MVMKKNAMRKNLTQSIMKSLGRYIAIVAIIALGASMFVGLLMTKSDMVATGQKFMDEQNMFDLRLMNSYGWDQEHLDAVSGIEGIVDVEGLIYLDAVAKVGDAGEDSVYRFYSIPETVNRIDLRGGRMPESPDECLAEGYHVDDSILGTTVTISETNEEDTLESMVYETYTIVGYVATPLYMDMNHGTTSVGNGSLASYFFVPRDGLDVDYYTEINITIPGEYDVYSKAYHDAMEAMADYLEPLLQPLADDRLRDVRAEALEEYSDGLEEYIDGAEEFIEGKAEAEQELAEAEQELLDAQQQIADNEQMLEDGEEQIAAAKETLKESEKTLQESKKTLASSKASAYKQASQQIQSLLKDIAALQGGDSSGDEGEEQEEVSLDDVLEMMEDVVSMTATQAVMDAEFAAADAQIEAGEAQIAAGYLEIELQEQEIADGWIALEEAKLDLEDGWEEFYEGKEEAEAEIADAQAELAEAKIELDDAWDQIYAMQENDVFILDRTSNVGYNSLDSSSDIVQGVSRVFPAFFLLVAALVCITTMTRMIDEERTQIGTLKALGYSEGAIISKYLIYAGSGAVVGCGLGVIVGSVAFPSILWEAYKIMLYITDGIVLRFNWWLCGAVVAAYTIVMLLVTWYCCRCALQEEPAELIRPKAPAAGKKIFMEYLPFWHRISFLNKVTIRNILRYRQRLAMMMVGIGGCTALLVTGFGLRDSITTVVDYQFEEVTTYDMAVYFNDGQTPEEQKRFLRKTDGLVSDTMFYHQSSIELDFNNQTKEIYLIAAESGVEKFIDLHTNSETISLPGINEVVLSVGAAEAMGIDIGDTVQMRDAELQVLTLTVSGIYDNHVYNYAIVSPATMEAQWGEPPLKQMAFVKVAEGQKAHEVSAKISGLEDVMNVAVSEDLASMVGNMMDALDLVVWVIVFCAGLLAAIVLYNLTNININERIREIATIKVLGFNATETAMYVFKENLTLSGIGSVVGIGLGYLLLLFVMSQIKIDMVWFKAVVMPASYILSVVLTMLAAVIVDFIFYFKLDKINMAEALKSVE